MNVLKDKTRMIEETKEAKNLFHGGWQILITIGIFFVTQTIISIIVGFIIVFHLLATGQSINDMSQIMKSELSIYLILYGTSITIVAVIFYVIFIEKRKLTSMGFYRRFAFKDYLYGFLIGFLMFSVIILILTTTGNLSFEGVTLSALPFVSIFLIGFLIQGASEEIMLRGFLMNSLAARHNVLIAILVNSVLFGVLHLLNSHVTFLSILNIILFGIFASIYALKSGNIWGVCALHSSWNFVQGNIYGLEVSGLTKIKSIMHFRESTGSEWISGGKFGPEGSIVTSVILIISILIIYSISLKRNEEYHINA